MLFSTFYYYLLYFLSFFTQRKVDFFSFHKLKKAPCPQCWDLLLPLLLFQTQSKTNYWNCNCYIITAIQCLTLPLQHVQCSQSTLTFFLVKSHSDIKLAYCLKKYIQLDLKMRAGKTYYIYISFMWLLTNWSTLNSIRLNSTEWRVIMIIGVNTHQTPPHHTT